MMCFVTEFVGIRQNGVFVLPESPSPYPPMGPLGEREERNKNVK
jgi:hypothetical protein